MYIQGILLEIHAEIISISLDYIIFLPNNQKAFNIVKYTIFPIIYLAVNE